MFKPWGAFWDLLRSDCDADVVNIIGAGTLPQELEKEKQKMQIVLERFRKNCEIYDDSFGFYFI